MSRTLNALLALGLVAGLALGLTASATASPTLLALAEAVRPLGTAFLNAIRMVVIPLVAVTVFTGVAKLGDARRLGRLGGVTFAFFWATTLLAILLGMAVMALAGGVAAPAPLAAPSAAVPPELPGAVDFLVGLIPANPIAAAADGALLPLIVFTVLFGAATTTIAADDRARLVALADAATAALIRLMHWILWTGPVGIFALAAPVTAESGWALLRSLAVFVLAVILALAVFVAAVYLPLVRAAGARRIGAFLRASLASQTIGFTTTSSVAALPVMLEAAERELGVSESVRTLVLSLGASLNRAGSALFQGAAIVFLASSYDVALTPAALAGAVLATFFASLTVAPVPSASIFTMAPALETVGVPLAGLGILLAVDRIPDMFRTAVNVTGHMAAAVVVDRRVGATSPVPEAPAPVEIARTARYP